MSKTTTSQTPMMKQYHSAKSENTDSILFFRMGDFYEMFYDDAVLCSKVLGIALTSRSKNDGIPMAGVPVKSVNSYLTKLIKKGYKVAICEQVQDPAEAKGIVEREVVRVVTPGTITEDTVLEAKSHNFLLAISPGKITGLAWVDISTGTFETHEIALSDLPDELARIGPVECLLPENKRDIEIAGAEKSIALEKLLLELKIHITLRPDWFFSSKKGSRALQEHLEVTSLEGFGCHKLTCGLGAVGALLHYLKETQKNTLMHIKKIDKYQASEKMVLDFATRSCLEIHKSLRSVSSKSTLFTFLDHTKTAMGGRLLSQWVAEPLIVASKILERQQGVEDLLKRPAKLEAISKILSQIQDIERLCAKIASKRADARDLLRLKTSLVTVPPLHQELKAFKTPILQNICKSLHSMDELANLLQSAIHPDPKSTLKDGDIIRDGFNEELDKLRKLQLSGNDWLKEYEQKEIEETNIPTLKVKLNKVFGYYIEITNTHSHRVPETYIRKRTLKNSECYITGELKDHESEVLSANDKAKALEYELFVEIRKEIEKHLSSLKILAEATSKLDALISLAQIARERKYVKPEIIEDSKVLEITQGRHPVLDVTLESSFVPNDIDMGYGKEIIIITGPNMAGKSTYIRQAALIILLAQIGSFVPAEKAKIGIVDRIFTRIGSADEIAKGHSTFMVEMIETANILNNATENSFIALDEVGRGTSTFDGISLAWSIMEHIQEKLKARTLFATHYHEMTDLAEVYPNMRNYNVAIEEWGNEIAFLHKIVEGSADKSYGIDVARLAGIPRKITQKAGIILSRLERHSIDLRKFTSKCCLNSDKNEDKDNLFSMLGEDIVDTLAGINVNNLTPVEALNILTELHREAKKL